jgi:copper transport protein
VIRRGRAVTALALALCASAAWPASAWAHAALLRTTPQASGTVNGSPAKVTLTYDEAVEPRFAIISVTDAAGRQEIAGSPHALATDPRTLAVALRHVGQGWYLVYWRVISADGHPVRGAFTFAVGPNPGPAPQFAVPSLAETAATPRLVAARWLAFLTVMLTVGLFAFRALIARPATLITPAATSAVSRTLAVAAGLALVALPLYVLVATAEFAIRPLTDVSGLIPLMRSSALGRAYLDLEIVVALLGAAALIALRLDRPDRKTRSVAELLALTGAILCAAAALAIPGLAGHAAQTSPVAASLAFDWAHMAAASVWIGGLAGLSILAWRTPADDRMAVLGRVVPRFSRTALASVLLIIASGVGGTIIHMPTLASIWQTSYGQAILVKVGLLCTALVLGGLNFARSTPRLAAALARRDARLAGGATSLLRRLIAGEIAIIAAIILAAMVLTSLPPPAKALAEVGRASAKVGPGAVHQIVHHGPYQLAVAITPNRAAQPSTFQVTLTRGGKPVRGATVIAHFAMLDMEMGQQAYTLPEHTPGVYRRSMPALVMVGHWGLGFDIEPRGSPPFTVIIVDHAEG